MVDKPLSTIWVCVIVQIWGQFDPLSEVWLGAEDSL